MRPRFPHAVLRIAALVLVALAPLLDAGFAHADVRLFRPLTADPRENQARWRMSRYVEDWRYGTDVGDSTSRGGVVRDRHGISWEVAAGTVFRWIPLERIGAWQGPWVRYQLGASGGLFPRFDGTGILVNTDYQYGLNFDALWRGAFDSERGISSYRHSVVTSRLSVQHHSSHLGDEYLAQGSFARNQVSPTYQGAQLGHPPVKRMDLTYESVALTVSLERSGADEKTALRAYIGGETKLVFPPGWRIGGVSPANYRAPSARGGLEARSSGGRLLASGDGPAHVLNWFARAPAFDSEWLAAFDLRVAKPYNFASADNPSGETEAWTPRLWTASPFGREFRHYAGSFRGMIGTAIHRRPADTAVRGGRTVGPEWIVALEWYRGYAPDGQLLDQRLSYRPRGYLLPSVTAHF